MKKFCLVAVMCLLSSVMGCNQSSSTSGQASKSIGSSSNDGHDHPHDGETDHSVEGHAHGAGPHGGTIADWGGDKFHVEFTVDHEKQQATVYVLGSDEKTATPIDAESIELAISDPEMQVVLSADPQEGDPEGKSSRFIGTHEKLGVVQEYDGTMTGVVEGTPYSGDFKEEPGHDH